MSLDCTLFVAINQIIITRVRETLSHSHSQALSLMSSCYCHGCGLKTAIIMCHAYIVALHWVGEWQVGLVGLLVKWSIHLLFFFFSSINSSFYQIIFVLFSILIVTSGAMFWMVYSILLCDNDKTQIICLPSLLPLVYWCWCHFCCFFISYAPWYYCCSGSVDSCESHIHL